MYPVIRRPATLNVHSQTVTVRRGRESSVMREAPRELSAHRAIGLRKGGGGGRGWAAGGVGNPGAGRGQGGGRR